MFLREDAPLLQALLLILHQQQLLPPLRPRELLRQVPRRRPLQLVLHRPLLRRHHLRLLLDLPLLLPLPPLPPRLPQLLRLPLLLPPRLQLLLPPRLPHRQALLLPPHLLQHHLLPHPPLLSSSLP